MDESSEVTTVVEDHVEMISSFEITESLFDAPIKFIHCFALPSEYRNAGSSNTERVKFKKSIQDG